MRFLVGYIFKIKENWSRSYKIDSTKNSKLRFFPEFNITRDKTFLNPPIPPSKIL